MKKGDIIMVYEDPITQKIPEGNARLLRLLSSEGFEKTLEYWEVEFLSDGFVVGRLVD